MIADHTNAQERVLHETDAVYHEILYIRILVATVVRNAAHCQCTNTHRTDTANDMNAECCCIYVATFHLIEAH
jgi:hypothetical protein